MEIESKYKRENNYDIELIEYLPKDIEKINECVIACHGFGSNKKSGTIKKLAEKLNNDNILVVSFDFPGHGTSNTEGEFLTIENCVKDLIDVEKYIKNKYKDIIISVFASSFGGYITINRIIEETSNFKAIVLRCPAVNMYETFCDKILNLDGYSVSDLDSNNVEIGFDRKIKLNKYFIEDLKVHNVYELYLNQDRKNKMLILQGNQDELVSYKDVCAFSELDKENIELKIIDGAGHRFNELGQSEEVIQYAIEYIKNS